MVVALRFQRLEHRCDVSGEAERGSEEKTGGDIRMVPRQQRKADYAERGRNAEGQDNVLHL